MEARLVATSFNFYKCINKIRPPHHCISCEDVSPDQLASTVIRLLVTQSAARLQQQALPQQPQRPSE